MKKKTKSYFDLLGSIVHNTQKKALKELNLNNNGHRPIPIIHMSSILHFLSPFRFSPFRHLIRVTHYVFSNSLIHQLIIAYCLLPIAYCLVPRTLYILYNAFMLTLAFLRYSFAHPVCSPYETTQKQT
jgi:hypothetical protein